MQTVSPERQTLYILLVVLVSEGAFVVYWLFLKPVDFVRFLGFATGQAGTALAWILAAGVAAGYVWSASNIAEVRYHLIRFSTLKYVAITAAVMAAILEEVIFRKLVMDYMQSEGYGALMQILASGVAFGIVHLLWSFKNISAGINAVLSTTVLGCALGMVYIAGGRSLAPCVIAHFLITALIEPGLVLAAVKDKLGYWHSKS
jgi:membrane protease YdiL (CAAX protease family)